MGGVGPGGHLAVAGAALDADRSGERCAAKTLPGSIRPSGGVI